MISLTRGHGQQRHSNQGSILRSKLLQRQEAAAYQVCNLQSRRRSSQKMSHPVQPTSKAPVKPPMMVEQAMISNIGHNLTGGYWRLWQQQPGGRCTPALLVGRQGAANMPSHFIRQFASAADTQFQTTRKKKQAASNCGLLAHVQVCCLQIFGCISSANHKEEECKRMTWYVLLCSPKKLEMGHAFNRSTMLPTPSQQMTNERVTAAAAAAVQHSQPHRHPATPHPLKSRTLS